MSKTVTIEVDLDPEIVRTMVDLGLATRFGWNHLALTDSGNKMIQDYIDSREEKDGQ